MVGLLQEGKDLLLADDGTGGELCEDFLVEVFSGCVLVEFF